jgi:zinc protease
MKSPLSPRWLPLAFSLAAAGLLAGPATAQAPTPAALPAPTARLPLAPAVRVGQLPNGLTYYIRRNATPAHQAKLVLANKAGSLLEDDDQRGLAHFLEHMAFNGTRDYPKQELISYLQRAGVRFGADLNAYTTQTETVFELPLPTDQPGLLQQGVNILANWAGHLTLTPQEMEQERGIILEEARTRGLNADERVRRQLAPVLLNRARTSAREAIGLEPVIRTAPLARLQQFYHEWYRPDLQAVVAVGDFDPDQVEGYIKQYFSDLKNPSPERPLPAYPVPARAGTEVLLVTDPELATTRLTSVVRQPALPAGTVAEYTAGLDRQLFGYAVQQRLAELRRQPRPPFQSAAASFASLTDDTDALGMQVTVAHPTEAPAAVAALLREVLRPLSPAETARAKAALRASYDALWQERDKHPSASYAREYVQLFLHQAAAPGLATERDLALAHLATVTPAQLSALAAGFVRPDNRALLLQAPAADRALLPDAATLTAWLQPPAALAADAATAEAADADDVPLVTVPAGGRIVRERRQPAVGATELLLGNGVRVVLKPTALQNNEVLLGSYSFGGTSLASDADFTSAAMSAPLVLNSGVGTWPARRLRERLTGHDVAVAPALGELSQGLQGRSSPAELETALQLIYLYCTQPRYDSLAWATLRSGALASIAARSPAPSRVFIDTVAAVLSGGNFRRQAPTAARVQAASQAVAEAFYKARFGNAAGFTFVLVGNIDSATVRPLLARYLGALPALPGQPGTYRNLHIAPPAGPLTKVVRLGHDDKATVRLVFQGKYQYSARQNMTLHVLEDLLELRLLARLREQEGGVYTPSVQASASKLPTGRYSCTILFDCAPANADKLVAATLDEINTLATNGPAPDDFAKVLAEQRADLARQGTTNAYWLGYLLGQYQNDEPLAARLAQPRLLAGISPADARRAARRYLAPRHLLRLELRPVSEPPKG